jgi:magnesium-transporting ATPase (P-type)
VGKDSESLILTTAIKAQILDLNKTSLLYLDFKTHAESYFCIKNHLKKLKKFLVDESNTSKSNVFNNLYNANDESTLIKEGFDWNNYAISLKGKTVEIIMQDRYLYNHVQFLLFFSRGLFGYEMNETHKKNVAEILSFQKNSKNLLVIGNGYCDLKMLKKAKIKISTNPNLGLEADLYCRDFQIIDSIMFKEVQTYTDRIENYIFYMIYSCLITCFPLLIFFFLSEFRGLLFMNNFQFIYFGLLEMVISTVVLFIYDDNKEEKEIDSETFLLKQKRKRSIQMVKFLKTIIVAMIDITLVNSFVMSGSFFEFGNDSSFLLVSTEIYILNIISVSFFFIYYNIDNILLSFSLSFTINLFLYVIFFSIGGLNSNQDIFNDDCLKMIVRIITNGDCFFMNFYIIGLFTIVHRISEMIAQKYLKKILRFKKKKDEMNLLKNHFLTYDKKEDMMYHLIL